MSEPEVKFEIDEYGRIGYRVTNEGVLLSKEEKELIISTILCLQEQNVKLRELVQRMHGHIKENCDTCDGWYCSNFDEDNECCVFDTLARELGVEVDDAG